MKATIRIAPWHVGHARGSTSKICWSSAAHRRLASVGARRGAGTITGGASAVAGAADAIAKMSDLVAPYPFADHVLLDGPERGMEYPGLTMSDGTRFPHEIVHQWFPMLVGSDETRFDFLDEGLANFYSGMLGGGSFAWVRAERAALVPLVTDDLRSPRPVLGYGRGSRMFHALAAQVGERELLVALQRYAAEWRRRHPTPWDFMASMERRLGRDLSGFWRERLFGADAIVPR